jgi:hypothetical protein
MATAVADGASGARRNDKAAAKAGREISVSDAFSLGWNVCLLYASGEQPEWQEQSGLPDRLPSPSVFSEPERSLIRLGQVRNAVHRLSSRFPAREGEESLFAGASVQIEALIPRGPGIDGGSNPQENVRQAHRALARALSVCDARLAKAYHLGCDLACTCNKPKDRASLEEEFERRRIAQIGEALADLTSLLPDHSSRAVRLSCAEWRRWVQTPELSVAQAGDDAASPPPQGFERAKVRAVGKTREIDWSKEGDMVRKCLVRQGEVWRALLSGEKPGTAMLELQDYFATGARALKNAIKLLRGVWIPIVIALLLLLAGCLLLVTNEGALTKAAGLVTVAGSAGITWKGILGGLGPVIDQIQDPVWGAALDEEIAAAITCLPEGAQEVTEEAKKAAPAAGPQPSALAAEVEAQPGRVV